MHVIVIAESSAGGSTKIHSDVEAIRLIGLGQNSLRFSGQPDEVLENVLVCFEKVGGVANRSDHDMTVGVRIPIQHDNSQVRLDQDERLV